MKLEDININSKGGQMLVIAIIKISAIEEISMTNVIENLEISVNKIFASNKK